MPAPNMPLEAKRVSAIALLFWLCAAGFMLATVGPKVPAHLGDSDDALRLQQVRDLLFGGQGWYDLIQHRFNPPDGVFIHWSRLIDIPLALMILTLKPFLGLAAAEAWTQRLWPMVPILPLLIAVGVIAGRLGGRAAALIAMAYAAVASCFVTLFTPGRIDHHNVQLAATLVLFACILVETRIAAILGGIAAALMLAIGMETLPYSVLAGVVLVIRWIAEPASRAVMVASFTSFSITGLLFFAVTVAPWRWAEPACDMISPVYLAPIIVTTLTLAMGSRFPIVTSLPARFGIAFIAGLLAIASVALLNPICLKGPYAAVDPRLFTLWMNDVAEARSGLDVFLETPQVILAVLSIPLAAIMLGAGFMVLSRDRDRFGLAAPLALVAVSFAIALWQVRAAPFSTMFAVPLLAALLARFVGGATALKPQAIPKLALFCLMLNPLTLPLFGVASGNAIALSRGLSTEISARGGACGEAADYIGLAALPPGLVIAPVDLGSFIVATTAHSALAAPYHRDQDGILDAIALFSAPDAEAKAIALRRKATYLAYCALSGDVATWGTGGANGLEARLQHGLIPEWLEPVPPSAASPLRIFWVKPQ